jgi:hypothetical protein
MTMVKFPVGAEFFLFANKFRSTQLHMQCEAGELPLTWNRQLVAAVPGGDREDPIP